MSASATAAAEGGGADLQSNRRLAEQDRGAPGNGNLYMEIFNANKDVLTDPDKLKPGMVLKRQWPPRSVGQFEATASGALLALRDYVMALFV